MKIKPKPPQDGEGKPWELRIQPGCLIYEGSSAPLMRFAAGMAVKADGYFVIPIDYTGELRNIGRFFGDERGKGCRYFWFPTYPENAISYHLTLSA